jgi:hypothetical protein
MSPVNKQRNLAFAGKFITACLVENVKDYTANGIVINLSNEPMKIGGAIQGIVPRWKSTILRGGTIASADRVAIIDVPNDTNLGGLIFNDWDWFGNRFDKLPRTTPLYISPYDTVGEVELNPFTFSNIHSAIDAVDRYDIRLNLWWAPSKTDAFIHNEHSFLEIHTQILGLGRIQIYHENNESTLYREITTAPGDTHDPIVRVTGKREWSYPWHRGWTDTDAIWLAIELHPKA